MENTLASTSTVGSDIDVMVWMACSFTSFRQSASIINSIQSCLLIPRVTRVILSVYANVAPNPIFPRVHDPANWPTLGPDMLHVPDGKILTVLKKTKPLDRFEHYRVLTTLLDGAIHPDTWITLCEPKDMLLLGMNECYDRYAESGLFFSRSWISVDKKTGATLPDALTIPGRDVDSFVEKYAGVMDTDVKTETGMSMRFHIMRDFLKGYKLNPKAELFGEAGMTIMNQNALIKMMEAKGARITKVPVVLIIHGLDTKGSDLSELLGTMLSVSSSLTQAGREKVKRK